MLSALLAQRLDPTPAGSMLLLNADLSAPEGMVALIPPWSHTTAATASSTAVIAADDTDELGVWSPQTGQLTARRTLERPLVKLASSQHSQLAVSVDTASVITVWDLADPYHPDALTLGRAPVPADQIAAIGPDGNDVLLLTTDGTLYPYDVATGARLPRESWQQLTGHRSSAAGMVTAASLATNEYSDQTTVLIGTASEGVIRVELGHAPGRRVIAPNAFTGTVTSLLEIEYSEPRYVLGTTAGVFQFNEHGHEISARRGPPDAGLALTRNASTDATTLYTADAAGTTATPLNVPTGTGTELPEPSGRPMASMTQGATGPVGVAQDGTILFTRSAAGLSRPTAEATSIATFTPDGDLLETRGENATHVERIVKVRPDASESADGFPEDHIVKSYYPAHGWWSSEEASQVGWYVNSAVSDGQYVAAGGQDPTHTAVVLVWNAKTGRPIRRLALTEGAPLGTGVRGETAPSLVTQVVLLPHRHLLAAYSTLQELLVLWSTDTWQEVASIPVGPIADFDVSPDESTVMLVSLADSISEVHAGNTSSRLLFVDLSAKQITRTVAAPGAELAAYDESGGLVVFSDDGERIAQRTSSGTRAGARTINVEGNPNSIAIRAHSSLVALGSRYGGVMLANLQGGQVSAALAPPPGASPIDVDFSPNGALLVATNGIAQERNFANETQPSLWNLSDGSLERRLCELAGGNPSTAQWRAWFPKIHRRELCPIPRSGQPAQRTVAEPEIAYQVGETIYVADRSGGAIPFGSDGNRLTPTSFAWSPAGAVAWLSEDTLNVVQPGRGLYTAPCPCSGVRFAGEEVVALEADGSTLLRFPPALTRPRRRVIASKAAYQATLLAATPTGALASGFVSEPMLASNSLLYRILPHGLVQPVRHLPNGQIQPPTATSPDGKTIALVSLLSGGACFNPERILLLDTQTGKVTAPSMPAGIESPTVRSLWWTPSGQLDAMIAAGCAKPTGGEADLPLAQEYRLEGKRLQPTGVRAYSMEQTPTATAKVIGGVPDISRSGTLIVENQSGRVVLRASGVRSFALRP
jgi:WD40 repeat protein